MPSAKVLEECHWRVVRYVDNLPHVDEYGAGRVMVVQKQYV